MGIVFFHGQLDSIINGIIEIVLVCELPKTKEFGYGLIEKKEYIGSEIWDCYNPGLNPWSIIGIKALFAVEGISFANRIPSLRTFVNKKVGIWKN